MSSSPTAARADVFGHPRGLLERMRAFSFWSIHAVIVGAAAALLTVVADWQTNGV